MRKRIQHIKDMITVAVKKFQDFWWCSFVIFRQNINMATNGKINTLRSRLLIDDSSVYPLTSSFVIHPTASTMSDIVFQDLCRKPVIQPRNRCSKHVGSQLFSHVFGVQSL